MKALLKAVQSKNKVIIEQEVRQQVAAVREWLQEHGEWALLVGVLAGVLLVLFFKAIVLLVVLGGLASYIIWQLSVDPAVPTAHQETVVVDEATIVAESTADTGDKPDAASDTDQKTDTDSTLH